MHFSDTCKANSLSFSSIEKKRHFVNLFIVSMSGLGLLLILVTALFFAFEKITYRTVIHMNDSHAEEIDSFSEFVSSSLFSGAEQISCSSSVRALMAEPSYTNGTELNQHLTELCAYVDAADYLDGIYVWNPYNSIVYSTDQNRAQQSLDELQPSVLRNFFSYPGTYAKNAPVHFINDKTDNFAIVLCEKDIPPESKRRGVLLVTIKASWFEETLFSSTDSGYNVVLDEGRNIIMSSSKTADILFHTHLQDNFRSPGSRSGYFKSNKGDVVGLYYCSSQSGLTYIRILEQEDIIPGFRQLQFIVYCLLIVPLILLLLLGILFLVYRYLPLRKTLEQVHYYQRFQYIDEAPCSLRKTLKSVLTLTERGVHQRFLYDMLIGASVPDADLIFLDANGNSLISEGLRYGLFLTRAPHRSDIYDLTEGLHDELTITKVANVYAVAGAYKDASDYNRLCHLVSDGLSNCIFASGLFDDFMEVRLHFERIYELYKLALTFPPETKFVPEEELDRRTNENSLTTRDYTTLVTRLKSGNLDAAREKWAAIRAELLTLRYDKFQYTFTRLANTLMLILQEFPNDLLENPEYILPEQIEQMSSMEQIDLFFDRAFVLISDNYANKKQVIYDQRLEYIRQYILENYRNTELTSQEIADHFEVSNAYLGRIFRQSCKCSVSDYINSVRIEEAAKLLRECALPVDQIASQVGFSNIKYFYVLFKKAKGVTPSTYRG